MASLITNGVFTNFSSQPFSENTKISKGSSSKSDFSYKTTKSKPHNHRFLKLRAVQSDTLTEVADSHLNSNVGKLDFEDAKFADSPRSKECTLILAQGGYATHFARSVLSVLGKDKYAVFPLKGKLLNVREAGPRRLLNNATIQNIIKILGLQRGNHSQDVKDLRYGHLMFMVSQGHDGSHIIGLLINFLYHHSPALLKVNKFMLMFITPLVMAFHKETNAVFTFYTISKYAKWKQGLGNKATEYKILGSETIASPEESKYFFADFDQHIKDFYWVDGDDDCAIKYAFGTSIDKRNHYLNETDINYFGRRPQAGTDVDSTYTSIRYLDFFKKEFMQYLEADRQRSIPSIVDGLTLGQRKILSHAFKMPITQEIAVGQFSDDVFEHSPNDHGGASAASLVNSIIGMAQNYVGSNNINLLQPIGVFGTRFSGGKDHDARGEYLFTQLSPITRYLFHKDDERTFKYLNDDGQSIELAWFSPIIPMVLVNGSKGSGTECSSFIPNYNPRDIIANLIRRLNGRKMLPMVPWYKGFIGKIKKKTSNEFTTEGLIKKGKNGSTITVTELPVGMWTENYLEHLRAASRCGDHIKAYKSYNDYYNPDKVHFEIAMAYQMKSAKQEWFLNEFKLKTTLSTANMYLLDKHGKLKKYATPEEILEDFFQLRLGLYEKRTALLRELKIASGLLKNKVEFIGKVRKGEIILSTLKKKDRCAILKTNGIQSLPSIEQAVDNGGETEEKEPGTGYDYLLSIPIGSFGDEEFKELERERDAKVRECEDLSNSTPETLWLRELKALDLQLAKEYTVKINSGDVDSEIAEEAPKMKASAKRRAARPQRANKKSRRR